jgi:hypothetical protein
MAQEITVYVNAVNTTAADYGWTDIRIPPDDKDRAEFLANCEEFYKSKGRTADADKFHQAIKQTPLDPTDD